MRTSWRCLISSTSIKYRGLPPLPPVSLFPTYFKRGDYKVPPDGLIREFPGRILLASRQLCDDFVKAVKLRKGEVVIEAWPGHGQLTRSLLEGGNLTTPEQWTEEDITWAKDASKSPSTVHDAGAYETHYQLATRKLSKVEFPTWDSELLAGETSDSHHPSQKKRSKHLPRPALVVTAESSPALNVKALGLPFKELSGTGFGVVLPTDPGGEFEWPTLVCQSPHEPRLAISPNAVYRWSTLPAILSDPLVDKHLPRYTDPGTGVETRGKRSWNAPEPNITLVGHIPASLVGEQMLSQWIGSVVGDLDGNRSWIWQWGRIRMALLVGRSLYDSRESVNCKLSILTRALFDLSPLPPYHHVPNIDKIMSHTEARPMVDPPPAFTLERTITSATDFYPIPMMRGKDKGGRVGTLPRPVLLGLMLTPKKNPIITIEQKDNWDYVLRKCFAREAIPIKTAVQTLGFGAENLIPKIQIESGGPWKGDKVDPDKIVRDLDVGEWHRIVDVFDKWAFKPDNLILDRILDDFTRQIIQD